MTRSAGKLCLRAGLLLALALFPGAYGRMERDAHRQAPSREQAASQGAASPVALDWWPGPAGGGAGKPPVSVSADWKTYVSQTYGISLRHPPGWGRVPGHGEPAERYGGADGFFQIDAASSPLDLDGLARQEASHRLKPYGTAPAIERLEVDGRPARLILPSPDQPEEMRGQAMLVVEPPAPLRVAGGSYRYFVLYADREHIRPIAATLRFRRDGPGR